MQAGELHLKWDEKLKAELKADISTEAKRFELVDVLAQVIGNLSSQGGLQIPAGAKLTAEVLASGEITLDFPVPEDKRVALFCLARCFAAVLGYKPGMVLNGTALPANLRNNLRT